MCSEGKTQNGWEKDSRSKRAQKDSGRISNGWQKESGRKNSMIYPFDIFKLSKLSVCYLQDVPKPLFDCRPLSSIES